MSRIGEIRKGIDIGKKGIEKYIYHACIVCGKPRWVRIRMKTKLPKDLICRDCASVKQGKWLAKTFTMEKNPQWKGGRVKSGNGYILIRLPKNDFFYPMAIARNGYVLEHRLVVAKALGRCLHSWEIVHHKGTKYPMGSKEDKADNRYPENLQLVSDVGNRQIYSFEKRIAYLEKILRDNAIRF